MPVKTRWIIPNSLDKRLLSGGCTGDFYQAVESINERFEKSLSFRQASAAAWERRPLIGTRPTRRAVEAPGGLVVGWGRQASPAFLLINVFPSWFPGDLCSPGNPLQHNTL